MNVSISFRWLLATVVFGAVQTCQNEPMALTLAIPKEGFSVVQQEPSGAPSRATSTLYQTPRSIRPEEFGTPELQRFTDSLYAVMVRQSGVGIAANQIGKRLQIFLLRPKQRIRGTRFWGPWPSNCLLIRGLLRFPQGEKTFGMVV